MQNYKSKPMPNRRRRYQETLKIKIIKIPKNISEDIIYRLDSIARSRCNYEYGLPTIPDCEEM